LEEVRQSKQNRSLFERTFVNDQTVAPYISIYLYTHNVYKYIYIHINIYTGIYIYIYIYIYNYVRALVTGAECTWAQKGASSHIQYVASLQKVRPPLRAFVHHAGAALVQWQANRAYLFQPKIEVDAR